MPLVKLIGGTSFNCESNETIIEGALRNKVVLDHSCLTGRCSSCKFKVIQGDTNTASQELPLSQMERNEGYVLTCVRKPLTDIELVAEDLSKYGFTSAVTIPAKINSVSKLTSEIILVGLRLPPNQKVSYLEGQYVNVIWNGIKRSYSIASPVSSSEIQLIIKNYTGGKMSDYWFNQSRINDLLRLEIPKGTFFLRNHQDKETLIFLATGTGIAPIKAMIESDSNRAKLLGFKKIVVLWGMKYGSEIFWRPSDSPIDFIPVLSREIQPKKYVQDSIRELKINWANSVVYACGSNEMIQTARQISVDLGLNPIHFYSDAFVASN
jgi:CDP-4-dehydro-6-deoxyglucose reductase